MSKEKSAERLAQELNDSRLIGMCEQVLLPLLDKHLASRINLMCGRFREGQTDFVSDVAQISYIQELTNELNNKREKGNKARKELTNGNS